MSIRFLGGRVDEHRILLPPPRETERFGEFHLGEVVYAGKGQGPLFLTRENLTKHVGIFSITGRGKTNIGINLLIQLQAAGVPFLVVDWKRSYRHIAAIHENEDGPPPEVYAVGRNGPHAFHWNPLRGPPNVHPQTWLSVLAEVLEKSHLSGPGVSDIFLELFDKEFQVAGVYDGECTDWPNFHDVFAALQRQQFHGRRMLFRHVSTLRR